MLDERKIEEKKRYAGEKKPSMKRRSETHDYRSKRFYMITLEVVERMPILGKLVGDEENAGITLSPLGEAVAAEWEGIPRYYPQITMVAQRVMPDHFHGILYFSGQTAFHLGQVIKGFKLGCNRALRGILCEDDVALETQRTREGGEDGPCLSAAAGAVLETQRTREGGEDGPCLSAAAGAVLETQRIREGGEDGPCLSAVGGAVLETQRTREGGGREGVGAAFRNWLLSFAAIQSHPPEKATLWAEGYNDKILHNYSTLDKWKAYLQDNPSRLAVRRAHPDFFRVRFGIEVAGQSYAAIGNRFLLQHPEKVQVQLSRSLTDDQIGERVQYFLTLARAGAILVSPAISKGEQAVMRAALDAHLPIIFLTPWGFNEFSKPGHQYFEACSEGCFLILAPWEHQNEKIPLTRVMCLTLNKMTKKICEL